MIGVASMMFFAVAAASAGKSENASMRCATAVAAVLDYVASTETEKAYAGSSDVAAAYESARCVPSRTEAQRTFVYLVREGVLVDDHRVYVVEPASKVRVARGIPCNEHPSDAVCE